jgi:hypothetical protein
MQELIKDKISSSRSLQLVRLSGRDDFQKDTPTRLFAARVLHFFMKKNGILQNLNSCKFFPD